MFVLSVAQTPKDHGQAGSSPLRLGWAYSVQMELEKLSTVLVGSMSTDEKDQRNKQLLPRDVLFGTKILVQRLGSLAHELA